MSELDIRKCCECSFLLDQRGMIGRCVQDKLDQRNIPDISKLCMYDFPKEKKVEVLYGFGQGIMTVKSAFE